MGDAIDGLRAVSIVRQAERQAERSDRRLQASEDYLTVAMLADQTGMILSRCSESHYQLRYGRLLWNLYPGNCRMWSQGTPYVQGIDRGWSLRDVVVAVAKQLGLWKESYESAPVEVSTQANAGLEETGRQCMHNAAGEVRESV